MITLRDLLDMKDAVAANEVWLTQSDRACTYFERKIPLLSELVDLAIDAMHAEAETEERS